MTCYTNEADDTLVALTLLGNESAYEELVTRHERAVKGSAYRVTGNRFSAEDAAQDAFVSAWMHLDSLNDRSKFGSWVCSIAKNCAKNLVVHYRNASADISLHLLENLEATGADESGLLSELRMEGLAKAECDERLHAAVEALSEKIRETIRLHYFEELSVEEIAARLSVPVGTVKWRLHEGRKQLRKEYGIMDGQENRSLVARVMKQVEELKLWALKSDKTGFEADYRQVLSNVESLEESHEKQHALADVLMRGYWWLPGEKNEQVFARMKEAAEKSRNEDVLQSVAAYEHEKYRGQKKIDYIRNTQIPYLEAHGFVKTLAYVLFWLGRECFDRNQPEEGFAAYRRVLELLQPSDVYYANALSAIHVEEIYQNLRATAPEKARLRGRVDYNATGEVYRMIGGKLCFWQQPGYRSGEYSEDLSDSLFYQCSRCEGAMYDPDQKPGGTVYSSDGMASLTYAQAGVTVATPAGSFENCDIWVMEDRAKNHWYSRVESSFCCGIGLVRQVIRLCTGKINEWALSGYTVKGGDGWMPFAPGNRWEYAYMGAETRRVERENVFEVVSCENDCAVLSAYHFAHLAAYDENSWDDMMVQARREYVLIMDDDSQHLCNVEKTLHRAEELAETKRQKIHTGVASDVMRRIFATDPEFKPDYAEKGHWNFFNYCHMTQTNGKLFVNPDHNYGFEWKSVGHWGDADAGFPVLWNDVYGILNDAFGCLWSDTWEPGTDWSRDFTRYYDQKLHLEASLTEVGTVAVAAGCFENCLLLSFELKGLSGGLAYRGGKKEYWFAPGVGIIRTVGHYKKGALDGVFELTDYRGIGEGYFPVGDGFFRRYEAIGLTNGWHASAEYTYDMDEAGNCVIFANRLGTQDRANFEVDEAERKAKST